MKIVKLYRGHNKNVSATANRGIIWLTDDEDYALEYANDQRDGVVSAVYVDFDKLNEIEPDFWYGFGFSELDGPDREQIEEYLSQGYNCYTINTNCDSTIYALFSTDPIVMVEPLKETYQDKLLNQITESVIRRLRRR